MDDSYETPAENEGGIRRPKLGGKTLKPIWYNRWFWCCFQTKQPFEFCN